MSRTILGLDPGIATTGFGVISEDRGQIKLVDCGYIATQAGEELADRLLVVARSLEKVIRRYRPDMVAVEKLFFAKNRTTAIAVAQARGVILTVAAKHHLPLREYTPLQVKQSLTGYGRADKQQMQRMVKALLKLDQIPRPDDAADALAIAICAAGATPRVLQ
jgi:crossover junction endodeoxyribonuclease RuvC